MYPFYSGNQGSSSDHHGFSDHLNDHDEIPEPGYNEGATLYTGPESHHGFQTGSQHGFQTESQHGFQGFNFPDAASLHPQRHAYPSVNLNQQPVNAPFEANSAQQHGTYAGYLPISTTSPVGNHVATWRTHPPATPVEQPSRYAQTSATRPYTNHPDTVSQEELTMYHASAQTWSTSVLSNPAGQIEISRALKQKMRDSVKMHFCTVDAFPDSFVFENKTIEGIWSKVTTLDFSFLTSKERHHYMHSTMIWRNKIIKSISDTVWSSLNLSTFDKDALATALNNLILDSNFSRNLILQNDGTVAMFPNGSQRIGGPLTSPCIPAGINSLFVEIKTFLRAEDFQSTSVGTFALILTSLRYGLERQRSHLEKFDIILGNHPTYKEAIRNSVADDLKGKYLGYMGALENMDPSYLEAVRKLVWDTCVPGNVDLVSLSRAPRHEMDTRTMTQVSSAVWPANQAGPSRQSPGYGQPR